jgi:hypothetical protein
MIEPHRLQAGGIAPRHEVMAYAPVYDYGIPAWCGDPDEPPEFDASLLPARAWPAAAGGAPRPARGTAHPLPARIEPMA